MPSQARTISSSQRSNLAGPVQRGSPVPPPPRHFSAPLKVECFVLKHASQSRGPIKRPIRLTNFCRCPFKTHRSFVPNRPSFLHSAVSKPPLPNRATASLHPSCGRGDSDTALTNIASKWLALQLRSSAAVAWQVGEGLVVRSLSGRRARLGRLGKLRTPSGSRNSAPCWLGLNTKSHRNPSCRNCRTSGRDRRCAGRPLIRLRFISFDISDRFADGHDFLRIFIGDLQPEGFLERHYNFHDIQ